MNKGNKAFLTGSLQALAKQCDAADCLPIFVIALDCGDMDTLHFLGKPFTIEEKIEMLEKALYHYKAVQETANKTKWKRGQA